jgi:hypothetical protein
MDAHRPRIIRGIDPSPSEYFYADYDGKNVLGFGRSHPDIVPAGNADTVCIEMIASYGMPVGRSVFDTTVCIGRIYAAYFPKMHTRLITRKSVKLSLCGNTRAKDGNIRRVILDKFGDCSIKKGGMLHGVSGDLWAAIAVAIAGFDPEAEYYMLGD